MIDIETYRRAHPLVMVDMDHVLADYNKTYHAVKAMSPDLAFPQSLPGFFASLEPIDGAVETYMWLHENFDTWILTRPSYMNPHCYTDKRLWVEKHLGLDVCQKLIICPDKSLVKGQYLIDDMPWPGFEGKQLLFGAFGTYQTWSEVKTYFQQTYHVI
jgi:5'(3')-deoxyribonucleotidase